MSKVHVKLFISYAHKDEQSFNAFKPAIQEQLNKSDYFIFDAWEDSGIPVGAEWHKYIQKKLKKCKIAILCVSNNFFASDYIKELEFKNLLNSYSKILIVPLYFGPCKIDTWEDLASIQFFKPRGNDYGLPDVNDFSFSDLIIAPTLNQQVKEENINKFCMALSQHIQQSYIAANIDEEDEKPPKISDKIIEYVILAAIVLSLLFIVYTFVLNDAIEFNTKKFNGTVGCAMFFGSSSLFMVNRKFQHS